MTKVEMLMEEIFAGRDDTPELSLMRTEMTANCEERFRDLVADGMTEVEALRRLREDLSDVEELLGERPCAPQEFRRVSVTTVGTDVRIAEGNSFSVTQYGENGEAEPCPYVTVQEKTLCVKIPAFPIGAWFLSGRRNKTPDAVTLLLPRCLYESISVKTTSGDAELHVSGKQIAAESVSGDMRVQGNAETVRIKTTSGDIHYDGQSEQAELHAVSGDISATLSGKTLKETQTGSVSGDICIRINDAPDRVHIICCSMSGDTRCAYCDAGQDAPVRVEAITQSGDILIR